jgi:hypothetical protein
VTQTDAALEAPAHGIPSVFAPVAIKLHGIFDRHRATVMTALIVILAFAVSIHFPDHGAAIHGPFAHPPR